MPEAAPSNSVFYGSEALEQLSELLRKKWSKVFFLVDENTHEYCLPLLLQELPELNEPEVLEVEAGEDSKSPEVLVQLWMALSDLGADRQSLLINVGGGMVSDLGGMLAGTYMRGMAFVNFPTSLLAMVDASTGGKTGINLNGIKNQVGLFLEPEITGIIPDFLESLPQRELYSGFAEMLKHGLIRDEAYLKQLLDYDLTDELPTEAMIRHSVEIKKAVVQADFKESGWRKILNFGHTIGHALETASMKTEQPLLHGEAVVLGMIAELYLSEKYLALDEQVSRKIIQQLKEIYSDLTWTGEPGRIMEIIQKDKKNYRGQLQFSLLEKPGAARYDMPVSEAHILEALNYLAAL